MKNIEFLYFSQEDVIKAGHSMLDTISVVENVHKEHADKPVENPPKSGVHPLEEAFIHAMPAF